MNHKLINKLKKAASVKMTKGEDFLYEGPEGSIKWAELAELLEEITKKQSKVETKEGEENVE